MSYILDALKKSEQERGHGSTPGIQTVHTASIQYRKDRKAVWPYLLLLAATLNLVVMAYFIYRQSGAGQTTGQQTTAPAMTTTGVDHAAVVATPALRPRTVRVDKPAMPGETRLQPRASTHTQATGGTTPPAAPAPMPHDVTQTVRHETVSRTREVDAQPPAAHRTIVAEVADASPAALPPLREELPAAIRQQLPTLTISAHVYSSNPAQRSMVINNQFLEQGDHVIDGLILDEITPYGAIFRYHGVRFRNTTVSGWQ